MSDDKPAGWDGDTAYGRMLRERGTGPKVRVTVTEEDPPAPVVDVRTTAREKAGHSRPAKSLQTFSAAEQIKAAMRHIIEVEWIGAPPCLVEISDPDLNAARERLWLLLGKLDDEAERRIGRRHK